MPRYVIQDSEDDHEPKTGTQQTTRKTRTALAASVVDSPVRRSTRIRHGSVNPDGSSPESVTSSTSSQVTRTTRRRAAENAAAAVEPSLRSTRTRKNSNPSVIVEQPELETASNTPGRGRSSKQNSVNNSPETPKPATRTRRSVRASSETKSPPPPVSRVTRRTRASSIEPEPIERVIKAAAAPATPTRRRRTQVSVLPSEPVLTEDANEDKIDMKNEEASVMLEEKLTPSPKKDDSSNVEMEVDKSYGTESPSPNNKSTSENSKELEELKPSRKSLTNDRSPSYGNVDNSMKETQIFLMKPKRDSLDKSKDLGKKIEDLLNKSTEDLEESPRDKENQKLNISPDKPRKSLEITVSNVSIIRGKSLGSTQFLNKSDKKWANTSLDEQVLSNKVSKLTAKEEMRSSPNSRESNSEKKKQRESITVDKSPEKSLNDSIMKKQASKPAEEEQIEETENTGSPRSKTDLLKLDEISVDNEVIEEFKLYDSESSKSDNSKPRLDLTVGNLDDEAESDSSDNIFEKPKAVKAYGAEGLRRMSLTLERVSPRRISGGKTSPQKSPKLGNKEDTETTKDEEKGSPKKKKIEDEKGGSRTSLSSDNNKKPKSSSIETLSDINSKREAAEEKSLDADDEGEETETFSTDKNSPRATVEKILTPKTDRSNQISDSDSSMTIDRLFHDISAEEWNRKRKSQNAEENRKPKKFEAKSQTVESDVESEEGIEFVKDKSWKENDEKEDPGNDSTDSIDTITLKPNVSAKMGDQEERKSLGKTTVEEKEDESEDEEMPQDAPGNRKSLNKSVPMADEASDHSNEAEAKIPVIATSQEEEEMEVDANLSEASTIPTGITDRYSGISKEEETKDVVEAEESPKKTPKSVKKKSPIKSAKKSLNKSKDVYEFAEFSGSEDDEKKTSLATPEEKSLKNRTPKKALSRNYSIVAVADSDSDSVSEENFSEEDSEDSNQGLPAFLFNVKSSDEEDDEVDDEERPEKSSNTIDSDIAREMNLAGDDELEYSDDEVKGDECRASESEHSNEEDEGSDLEDFVVADDAVESSEYSDDQEEEKEEEETPTKSKYKRILDKSSSEEEEGEIEKSVEENGDEEKEEEEEEAMESAEKPRRRSNSVAAESTKSESVTKRLSKSAERGITLSDKKLKKFDFEETEAAASPEIKLIVSKSGEKLKKFSGKVTAALDTTVDLCTPEENEEEESEVDENTSSLSLDVSDASARRKSLKKLRKKLSDDPDGYTPDKTEAKKESDASTTPKSETPIRLSKGSKEKTPKSLKKNQRDSMQIIAECGASTPTISDLNKTMLTPNSETPITKFLKKERLNESLPLLELTKRSKRLSVSPAMSKMIEDQKEDDISETEEQEEVGEDLADAEENDTSEEVQQNGEGLNGVDENSDGNESQDVDENGDKDEDENEDEDDENGAEIDSEGVEDEDEEEEESEGEESIEIKKKKTKDTPEGIKVLEKHQTSSKKISKTETEEDSFAQVKISATPKNRGRSNGEDKEGPSVTSSKKRLLSSSTVEKVKTKKRARLESVGTPQSMKQEKKQKIVAEDEDSDSDEAPESLGFSESRGTALQAMKDVASSLKAAKEAKKKKRKEHQARIREEREAKLASLTSQGKKGGSLKRLPDDFLENLSDVAQRPKKKLKMAKKEEQIVPSKSSFEPGKPTKSIVIEEQTSPLSTAGGTTQFSVINLQKTKKKQAKNAATVASFRERMLARNPRQPVSAYLVYQAKQKASGLNTLYRK